MVEKLIVPTVEKRIGALFEYNRRKEAEALSKGKATKPKLTITFAREFGCEAYPAVERLQALMENKTGEAWLAMDRALLQEVARNHELSEDVLHRLGERTQFLDDIISTFAPSWKGDKDYFELLCRHVVALASAGNVILMGRGSAVITQSMKNCRHFFLYASEDFKVRSMCRRLGIEPKEAKKLIQQKQGERDQFLRTALGHTPGDMSVYNLVFNNDRNSADKIAHTVAEYVMES
jgi:cytidylate kinase